jgi:hypothetical protein
MLKLDYPGLELTLDLLKYQKGSSGSLYDNWITCRVGIMVPGFNGSYSCDLLEVDFQRFYQEIAQMNTRLKEGMKARLAGYEPGVDVEFVLTKTGNIIGRYIFYNFLPAVYGPKLTGNFYLNQSYLIQLLNDLTMFFKELE